MSSARHWRKTISSGTAGTHSDRGLATNLHRLGVSDKVIQQILRHANVTTTMNIYVKTVSADAANAMKNLETMCATSVQPERLGSTRIM